MISWIYGEPCSGKSYLLNQYDCLKIDSHKLRELSGNWDLSQYGRVNNVRYLIGLSKLLEEQVGDVVVAAVTPQKLHRDMIRSAIPGVIFVLARYDIGTIKDRQRARFGDTFKPCFFEYD